MIYNMKDNDFSIKKGPIFANFVLADEINRAPAKVQSALLEAMAERQVSVGRKTMSLPPLFLVMATQNPIEQEGTYPLPEAQLDRFLMQINVTYPNAKAERDIILSTTNNDRHDIRPMISADDLLSLQFLVRGMPVGDQVVDKILNLVRSLRPGEDAHTLVNEYVTWAPGPRGAQGLMLAARARALLEGRNAPLDEDVIQLAVPVLRHRMALNFKARSQNIDLDHLITEVAESI